MHEISIRRAAVPVDIGVVGVVELLEPLTGGEVGVSLVRSEDGGKQ